MANGNRDDPTARASAHLGWAGRHPWWDLTENDWAPYPATVYRAAGSHAGSFSPTGVDIASDAWNGNSTSAPAHLVPADEAARSRTTFDPGSTPPWEKAVWTNPEAVVTGRPGSGADLARYARWWATACLICPGR